MTQKIRIEPVPPQSASLLTKLLYRLAKRRFGEVPEPFAVAAHHPRLMLANVVHEGMLGSASKKLPKNVRELAVFWTARTIGCSWCVDFGAMLQRLEGLDVDRLKEIDDYATSPRYTDDERAAIAYADAMTKDPHTITDEQVDDLRRRFGDDGVLELTYQIGVENMRARGYSALGITEQGFNSGDACRVPWASSDERLRVGVPPARRAGGEPTTTDERLRVGVPPARRAGGEPTTTDERLRVGVPPARRVGGEPTTSDATEAQA